MAPGLDLDDLLAALAERLTPHPRRAARILRNERARISSRVSPVRSTASASESAPQLTARRK
jgi:hypothetical protein